MYHCRNESKKYVPIALAWALSQCMKGHTTTVQQEGCNTNENTRIYWRVSKQFTKVYDNPESGQWLVHGCMHTTTPTTNTRLLFIVHPSICLLHTWKIMRGDEASWKYIAYQLYTASINEDALFAYPCITLTRSKLIVCQISKTLSD